MEIYIVTVADELIISHYMTIYIYIWVRILLCDILCHSSAAVTNLSSFLVYRLLQLSDGRLGRDSQGANGSTRKGGHHDADLSAIYGLNRLWCQPQNRVDLVVGKPCTKKTWRNWDLTTIKWWSNMVQWWLENHGFKPSQIFTWESTGIVVPTKG